MREGFWFTAKLDHHLEHLIHLTLRFFDLACDALNIGRIWIGNNIKRVVGRVCSNLLNGLT
jgi:hypothetical protein